MNDDAFILIVVDRAVSTVEFVLVFLVRLDVVSAEEKARRVIERGERVRIDLPQAILADLLDVVQLIDGRGVVTPVFDDIVDLLDCFMLK